MRYGMWCFSLMPPDAISGANVHLSGIDRRDGFVQGSSSGEELNQVLANDCRFW